MCYGYPCRPFKCVNSTKPSVRTNSPKTRSSALRTVSASKSTRCYHRKHLHMFENTCARARSLARVPHTDIAMQVTTKTNRKQKKYTLPIVCHHIWALSLSLSACVFICINLIRMKLVVSSALPTGFLLRLLL